MFNGCKWCGNVLPTPPFYTGKYRFCSRKCVHEYEGAIDAEEQEDERRDRYFEGKAAAEREAEAEAAQISKWRKEERDKEDIVHLYLNGKTTEAAHLIATRKDLVDRPASDEDKTTPLIFAVREGLTDLVSQLVQAGANLEKTDMKGTTPIMQAASIGVRTTAIMKILIQANPDLNIQDKFGRTALVIAASLGHTLIVDLLIQAKANLDIAEKNGWTAIMYTASENAGYFEITKLLINAHANLNAAKNDGWTALMLASRYGHVRIAESLITAKADINLRNNNGYSALTLSAGNGWHEIVRLLISAKVDLNQPDGDGETAVFNAASNAHSEILKLLIDASADLNIKNNKGETALSRAKLKKHDQIVKILKAAGAKNAAFYNLSRWRRHNGLSQNIVDKTLLGSPFSFILIILTFLLLIGFADSWSIWSFITILLGSIFWGWRLLTQKPISTWAIANAIALLIGAFVFAANAAGADKLVDLFTENESGQRALHIAVTAGDERTVRNYLRRKLEIDALDKNHHTALIDAASKSETQIVSALIGAGANVNLADAYGQTPIYLAAVAGNKKIVEMLIAAKADVNARTTKGRRALTVAEAGRHYEIARILRSAGARR